MARVNRVLVLGAILATINTVYSTPARRGKKQSSAIVTCPGYPGYCSESYAGDTCLVVCARGRSNVPVCQDDGTWTDVPRCIEHEPGKQEQVPGVCPGVPGYCSLDNPGGLCTFECPIGPAIRSSCTPDGTWDPYPTCSGDPRETQDGCDPCPGPNGGPRNRTAEAAGGGGARNGGGNNGGTRVSNKNNGGNSRKAGGSAGNRKSNGAGNRNSNKGGQSRRNGNGNKNGGKRNNGNSRPQPQRNNRPPPPARNNQQQTRSNQQQPRSNSGFSANKNSNGGNGGSKSGGGGCPGEVLEACIDVCPGFSARVFSACVAGCARRCPGRK